MKFLRKAFHRGAKALRGVVPYKAQNLLFRFGDRRFIGSKSPSFDCTRNVRGCRFRCGFDAAEHAKMGSRRGRSVRRMLHLAPLFHERALDFAPSEKIFFRQRKRRTLCWISTVVRPTERLIAQDALRLSCALWRYSGECSPRCARTSEGHRIRRPKPRTSRPEFRLSACSSSPGPIRCGVLVERADDMNSSSYSARRVGHRAFGRTGSPGRSSRTVSCCRLS